MPIRLTVYRPDRMLVCLATDTITVADLEGLLRQLDESDLHRFRKIIDVSAAKPGLTAEELAAFSTTLVARMKDKPRGVMAIVADNKLNELARLFAGLTGQDRPAQVFRSIHDARKWVSSSAFPR
jgi:hypothetical protein